MTSLQETPQLFAPLGKTERPNPKPEPDMSECVVAPIRCLYTALWPIETIQPHPRNPNTHPDEQIELLAHILVTHTHLDHSGAAPLLATKTGAPTFGFGPHAQGRHQPEDKVEAGADWEFNPQRLLAEGDVLEGDGYTLTALHTPGQ